jgi:hypothetical protein
MFPARRILVVSIVAALSGLGSLAAPAAEVVYAWKLDGAQTQPDPIATPASGTIELRVSADRKTVGYRLTVEHLANAAAADVHLGATNQNGPIVVKLWSQAGGSKAGDFSGVLATGTFDAGDLLGPMTGAPLTDFVDELEIGKVYVNVHTNDGIEPANSGPGDFRLGEIRGQIMK